MTTGQDEADPRGPNLLAGVPGEAAAPGGDPAAAERLLAAVLDIGERLTALETAASSERPAPVTREELDAWGADLLKTFGGMVPKEAGADGAAMAEHAGKMEAAAERIDTALERNGDRFSAEIKAMEKWLAEDRSTIRASMSGIESAAGRIEAELGGFRKRAESRFSDIASIVWDTRDRVRKLNFEWRIFLSPWALGMFIAGAVFSTGMKLASRLL